MNLIALSKQLLHCAKLGKHDSSTINYLAEVSCERLISELPTDTAKKTFWINLYNAFVLLELSKTDKLDYAKPIVHFLDKSISLDGIEHGILRSSKSKLALGYLNCIKISEFEKQARVQKVDYRIHFALNCGANSCPPIYIFSEETIEEDIERVSQAYLQESICFRKNDKLIKVPRMCLWYIGDFGGFEGIRKMLQHYKIIGPDQVPRIGFLKYDWSQNTNNFAV